MFVEYGLLDLKNDLKPGLGRVSSVSVLSVYALRETVYMTITAKEAKEFMDSAEDYVLLDVREEDEFASGHLEGAVLIPYGSIAERAEAELPDRQQTILVYCRSGHRSAIAAESLAKLGYTDVRDFGGIMDWPYEVVK